jgi:glycosyltransferase involved in cell wall biosynthesis
MRVLVVSGIWPPDVGGPASHAPEVAEFLRERGHQVEVVTTADAAPPVRPYPVHAISRSLPKGPIHVRTMLEVAGRGASCAVLSTTSIFGRSAAGATLARRPYVVKLTADPAFERARRRSIVDGTIDEFQRARGAMSVRVLRLARDVELRRAAHVFTPSAYLRELTVSWGVRADRVTVLPNPAPAVPPLPSREELRRAFAMDGPTLAFAGRLTAQKSLEVALDALAGLPGVALVLAGEGGERERLERHAAAIGLGERVRFLGPLPRERVLELFRAADAAVLSSSWENFPHGVVEALAVGTPVISTAAGGVAEVVRDGENGLLTPVGDAAAFEAAIRRFLDDAPLRDRLRAAAAASVSEYARDRIFGRLEEALLRAGGRTRAQ